MIELALYALLSRVKGPAWVSPPGSDSTMADLVPMHVGVPQVTSYCPG